MPEKKNKSFGSYFRRLMKYALFAGYAAQLTACAIVQQNPDAIQEALSMVPATNEVTQHQTSTKNNETLFGIKANKQPSIEDIFDAGVLDDALMTKAAFDRSKDFEEIVADCLENPQKYPERFSTWVSIASDLKKSRDEVYAATVIQAMVNASLLYDDKKAEEPNPSNEEWFSTTLGLAKNGKGICGDLALTKALLLGWVIGNDKVWLLTGISRSGEDRTVRGHAVCVAELTSPKGEKGYYVLDNLQVNEKNAAATLNQLIGGDGLQLSIGEAHEWGEIEVARFSYNSIDLMRRFSTLSSISSFFDKTNSPLKLEVNGGAPFEYYPLYAYNVAGKNPVTDATIFNPSYLKFSLPGLPHAFLLLRSENRSDRPNNMGDFLYTTFETSHDIAAQIMQISPMTEMLSKKLGGTISFSEPAEEAAPAPPSNSGANMRAYTVPSLSASLTRPDRF